MKYTRKIQQTLASLAFAGSFALQATASVGNLIEERRVGPERSGQISVEELTSARRNANQSWSIAFDNDVLVPGSRDQDYTYGFNVAFVGSKSLSHWLSLHEPLSRIEGLLGLAGEKTHKIEYGLFGFTPEDIQATQIDRTDRPYASLIYTSSTTEYFDQASEVSWSSTLTFGVLGTDVVGDIQKEVHKLTEGDEPKGWDTQISDGGEPTARYNIARQKLIARTTDGLELRSTLQASVGYISEASWSLGGRLGKIHTPWNGFSPELISYGEKATPGSSSRLRESYFWAGFSLKARAYNAFLQGQFKNSEVDFGSDDVNHFLAEAWLGYTLSLSRGYRFTYSLRGHTSELKRGKGDRGVLWGGLQLAKTFG